MPTRSATPLLACALGAALCACPQQQKPQGSPDVVATINGEVIGLADFERLLTREAQPMEGGTPRSPQQVEPYKQTLLDTLIDQTLLLQAARDHGVTVGVEEAERRVLAQASEYPPGTFDEVLARNGTDRQALVRSTREQLTIEKLLAQEVFSRVAVTEEQVRRYFDEHPDDFQEPEQVHALQIVVKGLDDARRLQQQLWQGRKFGDLARRYSLSPDAKVGGDLGFFARGVMPGAFDDVVFKLPVGGTSDVVSTEYGFHLFRVLEKKPARKQELAEVRAAIEAKLVEQLRVEAQKAYLAQLRAKADIQVNAAVLEQATGRTSPHP